MKKLKWCFKVKDGIKIKTPSNEITNSYIELAKSSLKSAETMLNQKDLLWSTVMIYYAEYYALYSFLTKIGIKCENHFCSILLTNYLLGKEKTKTIQDHIKKRIDAQYYLKIDQESKIIAMLKEAKFFVADFENRISILNEKDIEEYRKKVIEIKI